MLEERLYALLTDLSEKVYPITAPPGYSTPCLVYNRIASEPVTILATGDTGKAFVTIQVDSYATKLLQAKHLGRAVRNALRDWQDDLVESCSYLGTKDWVDDTTDTRLYRITHRFRVFCDD